MRAEPGAGEAVLLLVSPSSGHGRALRASGPVAEALRQAGYAPRMVATDSLEDATRRAAAAPADSLVAALGGDGFIGAAAAGVRDSGAILLPLAGGRGNDAVRRLGIGVDAVATVQGLDRLRVRPMDLGVVNGRPFLGVANVGFDGLANERGNQSRLNLGPFVYLYGGLRAFLEWRGVEFTVTVDGRTSRFTGWFVAVGNLGQYGGGLRICPRAQGDDGRLDVVSLSRASILTVAATFLRSYRGDHLRHRSIRLDYGAAVQISANRPLNVYADGERATELPATVEILPRAVRVLAPADSPALSGGD
ncbi:diacylglycerol kinase family lipid kinase [Cellulosimicrobium funkei]|nr:diacylglycerol kinase family lipid kinase [Cellulosimicrobium funkei]